MDSWRIVPIEEIASDDGGLSDGPFGSNLPASLYRNIGVPVIRGCNLSLGTTRFHDSGFVYVDTEVADKLYRSTCIAGDIIFTKKGTIGQTGIIESRSKYERYLLSSNQMRLRVDAKLADPYFIFYYISQPDSRETIIRNASESGVPKINLTYLKTFTVPLPPLTEQKAIASVLSSLDDKIDLLHRQNKTLEAMAETLFRQWFVEEADDLVPITHYVDFNPIRKLSKGQVAPYLDMAGVSTSTFNPTGWYDREFTSGTKYQNGDTLLARITPCLENGKTAFVSFLQDGQVGWGSTEFIVMRSKDELCPFFTYALARNHDFREYAEGCMAGSSGRQRVDVEHLKLFELGLVDKDRVQEFNKSIEYIPPQLHQNMLQIRTLENLRDTLLPKLMSGEVRVQSVP